MAVGTPPPFLGTGHGTSPWMLLYLPDSVILMTGSGERIDAKVIARARTNKLVLHPKAKVNPATVN